MLVIHFENPKLMGGTGRRVDTPNQNNYWYLSEWGGNHGDHRSGRNRFARYTNDPDESVLSLTFPVTNLAAILRLPEGEQS